MWTGISLVLRFAFVGGGWRGYAVTFLVISLLRCSFALFWYLHLMLLYSCLSLRISIRLIVDLILYYYLLVHTVLAIKEIKNSI